MRLVLGEDALEAESCGAGKGAETTQGSANMSVKFSKCSMLCLLLGVIGMSVVAQGEPQLVDKIVAVVGDHPILYSEAKAKTDGGQLVIVSDFPSAPTATRMERAINDLINMQLVKVALDELDLGISAAEVEREIDTFLKQKGLTRADLDAFLRTQGKTYDLYQQDFKNQLVLRKFHGALIVPAIKITDEDLKTYYLKKSGNIGDLITFDLQQIFVAGKDKKLINEAYQRLKDGMPFDAASEVYHDQQSSATMTGVQLQDLSPTLRTALRTLQEGQFSAPLETEAGQHIFSVVKRRVSVDTAFAAHKDELELELRQLELASQTRLWLQKQRTNTNIRRLYP